MRLSSNNKGQGMIESMIAFLIIAGSVIALIRFQNYLAYYNAGVQQQGTAINQAVSQIETLKDFTSLTGYQNIATNASTYSGKTSTYTITNTITSNNNPTYKGINTNVTWTDRNNISQSLTLNTYIASLNPANSASIM